LKTYARNMVGQAAASAVKKYTGYGAYSRIGKGGMNGNQAPRIMNGANNDGSVVISNKEYLADIKASPTAGMLAMSSYNINPGDENTFPWLATIARNFQEYRLEGVAFMYRSLYSDSTSGVSGAQGAVIMSTQYDPTEAQPDTKQELENSEFAQSGKPSQSMTHFIECAKNLTPLSNLYIATSPEQLKGDKRFYNFGTFNIANQGVPATAATLGELWISYQVRLYKPKLTLDDGGRDKFYEVTIYKDDVTPYDSANPNSLVNMVDADNEKTYGFPGNNFFPLLFEGKKTLWPGVRGPSTFIITYYWHGTTAAAYTLGTLTLSNCREDYLLLSRSGDVAPQFQIHGPGIGVSSSTCMLQFAITLDAPNTFTNYANGNPWGWSFTGTWVLPAAGAGFKMHITQVPYKAIVTNN